MVVYGSMHGLESRVFLLALAMPAPQPHIITPSTLEQSYTRSAFFKDQLAPISGAVYRDEFYRSCFALLGDIYLSSEWSGKEKNGRIEFLVKGVNWGVECVRDGSKLDEHIKRFVSWGGV